MAHADPRARSAKGRGRAWLGNVWAAVFVLVVAGLAGLTTFEQLQQRWLEQAARTAFDDAHSRPKFDAWVIRSDGADRPAAEAGGGKAGEWARGPDGTARILAEATGGILILALTVALIRRSRPARARPIEAREKWASAPPPDAERAAPQLRTSSGSIAAERLSAAVWGDHLARQQAERKSA